MPSIAETLIGAVQSGTERTGANIQAGAQLAEGIQNMQMNRQKLEMAKQEHELKKLDAVIGAVEKGLTAVPSKARPAYFKGLQQNMAGALKLPFTDEFIQAITSPDVNAGAVAQTMVQFRQLVGEGIQSGDLSAAQAMAPDILDAMGGDATKFGQFLNSAVGSEVAAQAKTVATQAIAGPREQQVQARLTDQAATAVQRIHAALKPVLQPALNIQKGMHVLDVPNVSWKRINEVAQDFNKALTNSAVASDFKLKQLETPTLKQKIADALSFAESDPEKPADPKVVKFWMDFGRDLQNIYTQQINSLAKNQGKTAKTVYGKSNPTAVQAVDEAVNNYVSGDWMNAEGVAPAAAQDPKVADYANQFNMSYDQALQLLTKRGYKPGSK